MVNGDLLDQLQAMLAKAGASDQAIARGNVLRESAYPKVARKLGVEPNEVGALLNALRSRILEGESLDAEIVEALGDAARAPQKRFSFEKDYLDNVVVRDNQSGKACFLRGGAASAILNRLAAGGDEQAILAAYANQMESVKGRALLHVHEDAEAEAPHYEALAQTGFFGKQGAGCIVMAEESGRVLLALRSQQVLEPGTWGNWGGAVPEGVAPRAHALKELYEETGYQGPITNVQQMHVFEKGTFRYTNFLVVVPNEFEPSLNWEADDYQWCTLEEWPQPLHYGLKALFEDEASVSAMHAVPLMEADTEWVAACKARLDALPEGFTDWTRNATPWPEDVPELIGPGANEIIAEAKRKKELDEDDSFHAEIHTPGGSYNFPWRADGRHGYATARYRGRGKEMKIDILSIRDHEGEEVADAGHLGEVVHEQAIAFIGQE